MGLRPAGAGQESGHTGHQSVRRDVGSGADAPLKMAQGDFPGGPVVKNPPCTMGDMSSIPDGGTKILHAAEKLSPSTTVPKPVCRNQRVHVAQ